MYIWKLIPKNYNYEIKGQNVLQKIINFIFLFSAVIYFIIGAKNKSRKLFK